MAIVTRVNGKKVKVHVTKNIGFTKKVKDIVGSDELSGYEALVEEAIEIAIKSVPPDYEVEDFEVKPFAEVNVLVELTAIKKEA